MIIISIEHIKHTLLVLCCQTFEHRLKKSTYYYFHEFNGEDNVADRGLTPSYPQVSTAPWCFVRNVGFTTGYDKIDVNNRRLSFIHSLQCVSVVNYLVLSGCKYILERHTLFQSF